MASHTLTFHIPLLLLLRMGTDWHTHRKATFETFELTLKTLRMDSSRKDSSAAHMMAVRNHRKDWPFVAYKGYIAVVVVPEVDMAEGPVHWPLVEGCKVIVRDWTAC